jgi:hypothetical protein
LIVSECENRPLRLPPRDAQGTLAHVSALTDLLAAPEDRVRDEALERFIGAALDDAGAWSSVSDGVTSVRVRARTTARLRVCGQIWSIEDQGLHTFWLDVDRGDEITWTLYFEPDVRAMSARRARNLLDLIDDPAEARWVHTLTGTARRAP